MPKEYTLRKLPLNKESVKLIEAINFTMKEIKEVFKAELPKIYSKDLLELLFKHPYTKIGFLVDKLGITRKTATSYLRELENIGILESMKVGRDVYFVNKSLFSLLQNRQQDSN